MKSVAKVAVSLPSATLSSLERARRRLRKTRSSVVTEAIELWLRARPSEDDDRRYVEGYLRHPEAGEDAVARGVVATWGPWE